MAATPFESRASYPQLSDEAASTAFGLRMEIGPPPVATDAHPTQYRGPAIDIQLETDRSRPPRRLHMKLVRFGPAGQEKPGILDAQGRSYGCTKGATLAPSNLMNSGVRLTPDIVRAIVNPQWRGTGNAAMVALK